MVLTRRRHSITIGGLMVAVHITAGVVVEIRRRRSLVERLGAAGWGAARAVLASACPDAEALAAWVDRGLPAAEHEDVMWHLCGCAECRDVVTMLAEWAEAEGGNDA
jgi:hypothetical protein